MKRSGKRPSSLVTNGKVCTGATTESYRDNYDRIFGKKSSDPYEVPFDEAFVKALYDNCKKEWEKEQQSAADKKG